MTLVDSRNSCLHELLITPQNDALDIQIHCKEDEALVLLQSESALHREGHRKAALS